MWTAVNHFRPGILAIVVGDHSAATFAQLWQQVCLWQCYFYVTDGWKVYPSFIDAGDHIVSKTYMIRVSGVKIHAPCHYERTLASKNIVLFQVRRNAEAFHSFATPLLEIPLDATSCLIHT